MCCDCHGLNSEAKAIGMLTKDNQACGVNNSCSPGNLGLGWTTEGNGKQTEQHNRELRQTESLNTCRHIEGWGTKHA